jgi:hypothetical protein
MDVAGVDLPFSIADEGVIPPSPGSIKCSMQGADREGTLCSIPLSCMPYSSVSLHVELNVQIQPPIFGTVEVALTVDVGDHLVPRHSHADGIFVDLRVKRWSWVVEPQGQGEGVPENPPGPEILAI